MAFRLGDGHADFSLVPHRTIKHLEAHYFRGFFGIRIFSPYHTIPSNIMYFISIWLAFSLAFWICPKHFISIKRLSGTYYEIKFNRYWNTCWYSRNQIIENKFLEHWWIILQGNRFIENSLIYIIVMGKELSWNNVHINVGTYRNYVLRRGWLGRNNVLFYFWWFKRWWFAWNVMHFKTW